MPKPTTSKEKKSEKKPKKSLDVSVDKKLPRPSEFQDNDVSFNFSRTEGAKEKKKPIYMKSFSPEKILDKDEDDPFAIPIEPEGMYRSSLGRVQGRGFEGVFRAWMRSCGCDMK